MKRRVPTEIISRSRILFQAASRDLKRRLWATYENHLSVYNRLVTAAYEFTDSPELTPISPLPKWHRHPLGRESAAEKAKLAEIVENSQVLYDTLKRARSDSGVFPGRESSLPSGLSAIQRIGDRFHAVARQLAGKKRNSSEFLVLSEYDLQRLFHGLLLLYFDDVRREVWTPTYAGGAGRMDFLIPSEGIVIETKMARKGLNSRRLGEELIADVSRYKAYPDCRILYCFVYDPQSSIKNPRGLEKDLMKEAPKRLQIVVAVRPRVS